MNDEIYYDNFEELYENEFGHFERIENPPSKIPLICAELLLEQYLQDEQKLIYSICSDEEYSIIYFSISKDCIILKDMIYLLRCGVSFDYCDLLSIKIYH